MFYYTGDIHGNPDKIIDFSAKNKLTENDTIVILGDVGANYYGPNSVKDHNFKYKLSRINPTVFCIHGNHEDRPQNISSYKRKFWNQGYVYVEDEFPKLLFGIDGMIYDFEGKDTLVIGGAYSVDKQYRLDMGYKWFPDEQPSEEIKKEVENAINMWGCEFDQILTHTCPMKYIPTEAFIPGIPQSTVDNSTEEWLDTIEEKCSYNRWLCGHFHIDKSIDKMRFLFNDFII